MLDLLIGPVTGLLDKFIPDADEKAKLAHEIATMSEKHAQQIALEQIEVLKLDAKGNWFQSSWRPLAGYTCIGSYGELLDSADCCTAQGLRYRKPMPV